MDPACGIEAFVAEGEGFDCVFKQRYEDFIVHELDADGQAVELTSLHAPEDTYAKRAKNGPATDGQENEKRNDKFTPEQMTKLQEICKEGKGELKIDSGTMSKEERKAVHQSIREEFNGKLESQTTGTTITVAAAKAVRRGQQPGMHKFAAFWPEDRPNFLRCVLYKEKLDSHSAVTQLCKLLNMKPSSVGMAGTKDRRACTTQHITVYKTTAQKMAQANSKLAFTRPIVRVGNFVYVTSELRLGDNTGNRFEVVLRGITADEATVDGYVRAWIDAPFLNYFGQQRFGSVAGVTSRVGEAMLKGEWLAAINIVLDPDIECDPSTIACLRSWATDHDASAALRLLGRRHEGSIEHSLLTALAKNGNSNPQNAFFALPRPTRTLYLHAYQSLMFNRVLTRRANEHDLRPILGDLVWEDKKSHKVRALATQEEVSSMDVCDVLMPLPGNTSVMSDNKYGAYYAEELQRDGLTLESFNTADKAMCMTGAYRSIMCKLGNTSYSFRRYAREDETLTENDVRRMQRVAKERRKVATKVDEGEEKEGDKEEVKEESDKLALVLHFDLPSGTYATMALRELTHRDLSSRHQTTLMQGKIVNTPTSS